MTLRSQLRAGVASAANSPMSAAGLKLAAAISELLAHVGGVRVIVSTSVRVRAESPLRMAYRRVGPKRVGEVDGASG